MKKHFPILTVLLMLTSFISFGQQFNQYRTNFGQCDTIVIDYDINRPYRMLPDTCTYKLIRCTRISDFGMKCDVGISGYIYNKNTRSWLGNHQGPSFGLVFSFRQFNFGARFKPWTVTPKNNLTFGSDTLTKQYRLNPIKIDYFLGCSFDFNYHTSIEPYIGYTQNSFHVINEEDFDKQFSIPKSGGLISGVSINKYFKYGDFLFSSIFCNLGYCFVDFNKVNPNLGKGYIDWTIGLALKGFSKSYKYTDLSGRQIKKNSGL